MRALDDFRDVVPFVVDPDDHHAHILQNFQWKNRQCSVVLVVVSFEDIMGVHPQLILNG